MGGRARVLAVRALQEPRARSILAVEKLRIEFGVTLRSVRVLQIFAPNATGLGELIGPAFGVMKDEEALEGRERGSSSWLHLPHQKVPHMKMPLQLAKPPHRQEAGKRHPRLTQPHMAWFARAPRLRDHCQGKLGTCKAGGLPVFSSLDTGLQGSTSAPSKRVRFGGFEGSSSNHY